MLCFWIPRFSNKYIFKKQKTKQKLLRNGLYLFPLSEFDIDHTNAIAGKSQNLPALLIIWVFCQVTVTQEHTGTGYHRETLRYLAYTIPEKMATSRFHIPTAKPAFSLADKVQCIGSPRFCDPKFLWNTVCLIANIQYISGSGATWEDSFSLKEKKEHKHHLTCDTGPSPDDGVVPLVQTYSSPPGHMPGNSGHSTTAWSGLQGPWHLLHASVQMLMLSRS